MSKILISLVIILSSLAVSYAQSGYVVSGKVRGMNSTKVYLVSAEFLWADTLASAAIVNEGFVLKGNLPGGVCAANLLLEGINVQVPILLENTLYQVSITPQGAILEGEGPASKLLKEFERIGREYATEQNSINAEYKALENNVDDAKVQSLQVRADNAYKESIKHTNELIKSNADSYISAYVIALGMAADDEETLRAKYELLSPIARATRPGKAIEATLNRYGKLAEGETAPDLTLVKLDGNNFTLHSVPAKWKLVHFWTSSNNASRQQNPDLVRIYLQFRPKGLEIISISLDTDHLAWQKAVGLDGMTWTNGSDLKGINSELAKLYLISELPAYFLLDAENRIVAKNLTLTDLRVKLAELTKRKRMK